MERRRRPGSISSCAAEPRSACEREAVPDLDALDRLDRHQRRRQPPVEPILAARIGAEPGTDAGRPHLDDPPERVAIPLGRVGRFALSLLLRLAADLDDRAGDLDPELAQQRLRDGTGRDEHGRVPRARALKRVPHVLVAVLERTGEIGVPRSRERHRLRPLPARLALRRPRAHAPLPVRVVAVADDERNGRPESPPVAQAGEHLDYVLLELLAGAPAVALLPATEVAVDRGAVELESRGQAGQDRDERRPVRFAGRRQPERHGRKPTAARITSTGAGTPVQRSNEAAPCATSTSSPSTTSQPAPFAAATCAVSPPSMRYASSTTV